MMKKSTALLTFMCAGLLAACETAPPVAKEGFSPGMKLIVTGVCQSREAALEIARAAMQDAERAEDASVGQYRTGACRYWPHPAVMVRVRAVILEYKDYKGRPTQVLQVSVPPSIDRGTAEVELYTITLSNRVRSQKAGD